MKKTRQQLLIDAFICLNSDFEKSSDPSSNFCKNAYSLYNSHLQYSFIRKKLP